MSNGVLSGALTIDTNGIDFSLSHFQFDYPRLNLTASYVERYSDQSVTLNIDGRETDAATVQNVMLAVDKENPVTRRVFEIIREAEVPAILFSARANNASDLKKLEELHHQGFDRKRSRFCPQSGTARLQRQRKRAG